MFLLICVSKSRVKKNKNTHKLRMRTIKGYQIKEPTSLFTYTEKELKLVPFTQLLNVSKSMGDAAKTLAYKSINSNF